MRIRIPDPEHPGKTRRIRIIFKTMCIISLIIALIVCGFGLPAAAEFPLALVILGSYAVWAYYETKKSKQEDAEERDNDRKDDRHE